MPSPEEMLTITNVETVPEKEIVIQFDKSNAPYWVGETARFTEREAQPFINASKAHKIADVTPDVPAALGASAKKVA